MYLNFLFLSLTITSIALSLLILFDKKDSFRDKKHCFFKIALTRPTKITTN